MSKKIFNNFRKGRSSVILLFAFLIINLGAINCSKDKSSENDIPAISTVEAPTFSPAAGTYNTDQSVTISTATEGAAIYYTIDGSEPTSSSTEYTAAISVAGHGTTMTIKAIAAKSNMTDSSVAEAMYTINYDAVAMPTFSPAAGTYSSAQSVTLSTTTESASIRYTTDGTDPTSTIGMVYSSPISVALTVTIKAIAYKSDMADSSVVSAIYIISSPTGISATDGDFDAKVTISWTGVSGATDYRVYRGTSIGSYPDQVGNTGGTLTIDDNSVVYMTQYYYMVQAYSSAIGWSGNSGYDSGYAGAVFFITKWGSSGTGDGEFALPYDVAVDSSGNVYVADTNNHRIQKFDSSGTFISKWGANGGDGTSGTGDGEFNYPGGVAVDSSGNVYVGDSESHRIQKFDSNGTFISKWGANGGDGTSGTGDGEFNYPGGVAVDNSGNVYIADSDNHRIQKFDSNGTFISKWGANGGDGTSGTGDGEFNYLHGIAVDSFDNVYVADTYNSRIQKFDSNGTFIIKWGASGTDNGQFNDPQGIAADSSGNVYVADTVNSRIQKFDSSGTFISKWGTNGGDGTSGIGDGEFNNPYGITVDSSDNVYVPDTHNNRIQKFGK